MNSNNKCVDINECAHQVCYDDAKCKNSVGGFSCSCPDKTKQYNKHLGCVDINECSAKKSVCRENSNCINLNPGFKCACKTGFKYNIAGGCTDINECKTSPCPKESTCVNLPGSFQCQCKKGMKYSLNKCVDINECLLKKRVCFGDSKCINKIGSYKCMCPKHHFHTEGKGCVLDKGYITRKAEFVFIIDSTNAASPVFPAVRKMIISLLKKYTSEKGQALEARVAVIQATSSASKVPLAFEKLSLAGKRIDALKLTGGIEANLQVALERAAGMVKNKSRPGASVLTFLITATELPLSKTKLTKMKKSADFLKNRGKLVTVHITKDPELQKWKPMYTLSEMRRYVFVIQYAETLVQFSELLYQHTVQMIQCPANYVKVAGLCKTQIKLGVHCRIDQGQRSDIRLVGSQWKDRCSTYKCEASGVKVIQHKCLGFDAKCYDLTVRGKDSSTYFPCMQVGSKLNWKCRCSLSTKYSAGKSNKSLNYQTIRWNDDNIETKDGKQCQFPFFYRGKWRYTCQPYDSEMWCSHRRYYDPSREWSFCKVKRAKNKCTDPLTNKLYTEDDKWSVVRRGRKTCDQMVCTKTSIKKIPRCQAANKSCVNKGSENYECIIDGRQSKNCLCVVNGHGWGKNEDIGGSKSEDVSTGNSKIVRTCFDVASKTQHKLNSTWINQCLTYRCMRAGATVISIKCKGSNGECYNVGAKDFDCIINRKKYRNCVCGKSKGGYALLTAKFNGRKIIMKSRKVVFKMSKTEIKAMKKITY